MAFARENRAEPPLGKEPSSRLRTKPRYLLFCSGHRRSRPLPRSPRAPGAARGVYKFTGSLQRAYFDKIPQSVYLSSADEEHATPSTPGQRAKLETYEGRAL